MSDERVWLTHPEHGGHFHCPAGAVADWTTSQGWVLADSPPEEHNPVIAENLAARRAQEQQAAEKPGKSKTWTKADTTEGN